MFDYQKKAELASNYIRHWFNDTDWELPIKTKKRKINYSGVGEVEESQTFVELIPKSLAVVIYYDPVHFPKGAFFVGSSFRDRDYDFIDEEDCWCENIEGLELGLKREYKRYLSAHIMESLPIEDHFNNQTDYNVMLYVKKFFSRHEAFKFRVYYCHWDKTVNITVCYRREDCRVAEILCDSHIWYYPEEGLFQFRFFCDKKGIPEIDKELRCDGQRALEIAKIGCEFPIQNAFQLQKMSNEEKESFENVSSIKFRRFFLGEDG